MDPAALSKMGQSAREKLIDTKKDTAMEFERIFARHLVEELTKGSFSMDDKQGVGIGSFKMYRDHITDTLANELAKQQKLGMADMLMQHWDIENKATDK